MIQYQILSTNMRVTWQTVRRITKWDIGSERDNSRELNELVMPKKVKRMRMILCIQDLRNCSAKRLKNLVLNSYLNLSGEWESESSLTIATCSLMFAHQLCEKWSSKSDMKYFFNLLTSKLEWLASNFSLKYYHWVNH